MDNNKIERNRRKFFFKYGFDIIKYADAKAAGLSEQATAELLEVNPQLIAAYENKLKNNKEIIFQHPST